jgi:hypothetical protein
MKKSDAKPKNRTRIGTTGHRLEVESIDVMRECGEESQ